MIDVLVDTPILLLVLVSALGYLLGQLTIKGSSLGVAAVLFVGLAFGALDPRLKLPEFTTLLGLILFVYAVGLSSGPGFVAALRRKGLRDNTYVVGILAAAALGVAGLAAALGLTRTVASGLFAGSLTNTPALAALLERIEAQALPRELDTLLSEPVVGYSIAYPVGIAGVILAIVIAQRAWKVDYAAEAKNRDLAGTPSTGENLQSVSILVTNDRVTGATVQALVEEHDWDVVFGRIRTTGAGQDLVEAGLLIAGLVLGKVGRTGPLV